METGQVFGVLILLVGFILLIGNVTGWWPSFPYAGGICMFIGFMVLKYSRDN